MRKAHRIPASGVDAGERGGGPPADVWAAINDPNAHAAWHPFLTEIEGVHEAGAERVCSVNLGGKASHTRERCVVDRPEQANHLADRGRLEQCTPVRRR
jgi:hypothetical protein